MTFAREYAAIGSPFGEDAKFFVPWHKDNRTLFRMMASDPSLSYDGARGLLTQIRDFAAERRA